MRGKNQFCRINQSPKEIARAKERRRSINFYHSFHKHGTIEFRIFPGEEPIVLASYMQFTIDQIQEFLEKAETLCRKKFSVSLEAKPRKEINIESKIHRPKQEESFSENIARLGLQNQLEDVIQAGERALNETPVLTAMEVLEMQRQREETRRRRLERLTEQSLISTPRPFPDLPSF